jgi:hypothetical protein
MEELKAKSSERLERFNQKGARLHDRISEVLGSPKGGEAYGAEEGEENEAEQGEEDEAEQGGE